MASINALPNEEYTVGWISALAKEYLAARLCLDERHGTPNFVVRHNTTDYTLGRIGKHNVVTAGLPKGVYGTTSATGVIKDMLSNFPNIRICFMVGIGGGAPTKMYDIRLGDIVVSVPGNGHRGVWQHDFGKKIQGQDLQQTGSLDGPSAILLGAVNGLEVDYMENQRQLEEAISSIIRKQNEDLQRELQRPSPSNDRLFLTNIVRPLRNDLDYEEIGPVDPSNLVNRKERIYPHRPIIHHGLIASGNELVKDAKYRDKLAQEKEVLCFEMEAAGLMNHFPCLIIRGICDYSDTHKNKEWQKYAALAAAVYTKEVLQRIPPTQVESQREMRKLVNIMLDLKQDIGEIKHTYQSQEAQTILKWLTTINYSTQYEEFLKLRAKGTGKWLLDSEEYQNWKTSAKSILFCTGMPGSGKTVIATTIIEDLSQKYQHDPNIGIAYIYLQYRRADGQQMTSLLASLLKQLSGSSYLPDSVRKLYLNHQPRRTGNFERDMEDTLEAVAANLSRVFIVVDALDEYGDYYQCGKFLNHIIKNLFPNTALNFLATSRPISYIEDLFTGQPSLKILATEEDVKWYVGSRIGELESVVKKSPELQESIKEGIASAVEGMFLLARFYFDSFKGKTTKKKVDLARSKLKKPSVTGNKGDHNQALYKEVYDDAMDRINSQIEDYKSLATKILTWITCAKRQLTVEEVQHALAMEEDGTESYREEIEEIDHMIRVCAGLVAVDKQSKIIHLFHYTTHEYFEQKRDDLFRNANTDIFCVCKTYLSLSDFRSGPCQSYEEFKDRNELFPLYDYAARYWGYHAQTIPDQHLVVDFLVNNEITALSVQVISHNPDPYWSSPLEMEGHARNIHLASHFGLANAMIVLLRDNKGLLESTNPFFGTPLLCASSRGHETVVGVLLNEGANIEAEDEDGKTPLLHAAEKGYDNLTLLLLNKDANIEAKDYQGYTPLLLAAQREHASVVKVLLDYDANVHARMEHGYTPLTWAAENGNDIITNMLLDKNADINTKDGGGTTPLSSAAQYGYESLVQLLLNRGADIRAKDDWGSTPLHAAIEQVWTLSPGSKVAHRRDQSAKIIKVLLNNGAIMEAKDRQGNTPLLLAIIRGRLSTAQVLIDHGADIEAKDNYGRTPLVWAARLNRRATVKALMNKKASAEVIDRAGRSPISYAAETGFAAVVQLLLGCSEVDVCTQDDARQARLARAAALEQQNLAGLLAANETFDPDFKDRNGQTAFSWAAARGHKSLVQLLLATCRVNPDSRDECNRSPLIWALKSLAKVCKITGNDFQLLMKLRKKRLQRECKMLERLFGTFANREIRENSAGSVSKPWHIPINDVIETFLEAIKQLHGIIKLLLEEDVAVNLRYGKTGKTPLQLAVRGRDRHVAQMLIDKGASVESVGGHEQMEDLLSRQHDDGEDSQDEDEEESSDED